MDRFELDGRIARDSRLILTLDLCQLRIQDDSRWPWLVMVPQRPGLTEVFDLSPEDQARLNGEVMKVAQALKSASGADKINIAAIGNIVRQLHVHVIARFEGDPNWPGPVWGHGAAQPYTGDRLPALAERLVEALS